MGEVRFGPGEVVFHEGEPSRTVLRIEDGEVEVAKAAGAGEVLLGTVGSGQFVGEMGVIEGRPRGATVRARGPVRGEMLERLLFLERVSRDPRLAFGALLRLSERLHVANERLADAVARSPDETPAAAVPADAVPAVAGDRLVLFAASEALAGRVPAEGVAIDRLPFVVGRRPAAGEPRPGGAVQLELEDAAPYRLSRRHFAVVAGAEGPAVRDDHSTLGTVVNGEAVGEQFPRSEAALRRGENLVVAGGAGSPFAFRLVVG
jgi:CRP/FNR family transcriptional regulator, cyclic AMP receptor protein